MHRQIAGGGLACLHQILNELFQPGGLPFQHRQIFLHLLPLRVGFVQQVHIVDDGGEGGLDVVGYVGDQLGLEPLAFEPSLHGGGQSIPDMGQILRGVPLLRAHIPGVDGIAEIPPGNLPGGGLQPPQPQRIDNPQRDDYHLRQQDQHTVIGSQRQKFQQGEPNHPQSGLPHQRQPPQRRAQPPQQPSDEGVVPQGAGFDAGGDAHEERQQQAYIQDTARRQQRQRQQQIIHAVQHQPLEHNKYRQQRQIQVKGNPIHRIAPGACFPRPPSGGAQQEHRQQQRSQQAYATARQNSPPMPMPPFHQLQQCAGPAGGGAGQIRGHGHILCPVDIEALRVQILRQIIGGIDGGNRRLAVIVAEHHGAVAVGDGIVEILVQRGGGVLSPGAQIHNMLQVQIPPIQQPFTGVLHRRLRGVLPPRQQQHRCRAADAHQRRHGQQHRQHKGGGFDRQAVSQPCFRHRAYLPSPVYIPVPRPP